ncbi:MULTISPECIES: hypothetical protein, partial [unclassified Paraburkholderia]|uniref:hypothetical protein n=1 Tax=unclassified Paraburkholderia TaxID=2615204 RepID=UPI002AB314D5
MGVTLVPARNFASATMAVLERDLIGRRFSSIRRDGVDDVDGMRSASIGRKLGALYRAAQNYGVLRGDSLSIVAK